LQNQQKFILKLKISPNSAFFRLAGFDQGETELRIKVRAPAHKGKANKEIIKELKKIFNSEIEIIRGEKSREKIVLVNTSREKALDAIRKAQETPLILQK